VLNVHSYSKHVVHERPPKLAILSTSCTNVPQNKSLNLKPAHGTGEEAMQGIINSIKIAEEIDLRKLVGR